MRDPGRPKAEKNNVLEGHSRLVSVALAVREAVRVGRLRVIKVVVGPEVVTELVSVREVGQAVCVHHREAVLGEAAGGRGHGEPVREWVAGVEEGGRAGGPEAG